MLRFRGWWVFVDAQRSELGFDGGHNSRVEGLFLFWLFDTVHTQSVTVLLF